MESTASLPGTTPSVGDLSAEFAQQKRPKSPPLAFEKTPNDSLAPLTSPTRSRLGQLDNISLSSPTMGRLSPMQSGDPQDLQIVVDQQASAIQLLHDAFAAERQAWSLERERLHYRIASLEKLLRTGDGYSPAKSPILSPFNGASVASPNSKPMANTSRLPSIAEDENTAPLSRRREGAPQSIDISGTKNQAKQQQPADPEVSVAFEAAGNELIVEDIPISPPQTAKPLSPPPFNYRMEAGHTPLRAPRPPTPPPQNSMTMDGIEDTPTRNNTHINTYLTRSNDEEEDKELVGPLNMPELPHVPGDANFTFEMLSKRLEQIEKDPDTAKPMVFKQPSPGLVSPVEEKTGHEFSPTSKDRSDSEAPNAAPPTRTTNWGSHSELSSNALSPTTSATAPLSKEVSREDKVQNDFETGGIKLKKKASTNFGAPFGQLGGFGSVRKLS